MAAPNQPVKTLKMRLLSAAIAAAPTLAIADSKAHEHQQWRCNSNNGQWQCHQQQATPGQYPKPPLAKIKPSTSSAQNLTTPQTTTLRRHSKWDWVAKEELKDPTVCKTGCEGAYVAPSPDWPNADQNPESAPLRATADKSELVGQQVTLTGNAQLSKGNRSVKADSVKLDRDSNQLVSQGHIEAREPGLLVRADQAELDTEQGLGTFKNASFLAHDSGMRGQAAIITRASKTTLDLQQASVTQCTPDDETWSITADEVHLNSAEGWGSAKAAQLKIQGLPLLYMPYMTFPIDDRRKTGFLWPSMGSSGDNGFELTTPFYLNLAPNFDTTIAPHYIAERGLMTELEMRHLNTVGDWLVAGSHLNDDKYTETPAANEDDTPPREKRWLGHIMHTGKVFGLTSSINYTKVSDQQYFRDLATDSLDIKRTTHLTQEAALGYRNAQWQLRLRALDHQTIDEVLTKQYQLVPQLTLERNQTGANFETEWLLKAEVSDFQHDQSIDKGGSFVTGQRNYIETGASFPMRWAAGFIIPTAKIRHLDYDLDSTNPGDDDSPSATTPLATLDMGLVFERGFQLGNNAFLQTLEPRLYYFYSDYEQQTDNPDFDSQALNFSYNQLFRDTRFSGHDRLDDANQASIGFTNRFIDEAEGREVLTISLGQIFYFEDRQVHINPGTAPTITSNSLIATEFHYQPSEQLWLTNSLLWDSRQDTIQEGGFGFHYQTANNSLYNLGYRYRREGGNRIGGVVQDLTQADASLVYPITEHWSLFGRFRYDLEENYSLDDMAGLQYEDCCWMFRVLYQQGFDNQSVEPSGEIKVERDYALMFEFQLKGLGSLGKKITNVLQENILGYEDLEQAVSHQ